MRNCILLILFLTSCVNNDSTSTTDNKKGKKNGLIKVFTKAGKLSSEINFVNGVRHGIGKSFYDNGSVRLEIPYDSGNRNGVVKRYFQSGKLYQETEFVQDKQTGIQKKYRENGQLKSECRFEDGEPCAGLREYLLDGKERTKFPIIVARIVDKVKISGEYFVYLSVSDGTRKVKYYKGDLTKSGCMSNYLLPLPYDSKAKIAELKYTLPVGGFLMEEANIIAVVTTLNGNSFITQKRINIAIDN